eukprot:7013444-Prorocentrum_lima.AAC.1
MVTLKHICCFCLGEYYANNKFLFIDQESTINMQRRHGMLGTSTPYREDFKVNFLPADMQKFFMQGPMK